MGWGILALCGYAIFARWAADQPVRVGYVRGLSPLLRVCLPGFAAITCWSWVILLRPGVTLSINGKAHELVHVRQWRRYPLTFPVRYLWASVAAWRAGLDPYRDNVFEREARGIRVD